MKIVLDENVSGAVAHALRAMAFDVFVAGVDPSPGSPDIAEACLEPDEGLPCIEGMDALNLSWGDPDFRESMLLGG